MDNTGPLLIDTGRGFSVLYNNRHLYSPTDPLKRAVLRSNQIELQNETLYIVSSPLLFYGVKELLERLPASSHIICFESSKSLYNLSIEHIPEILLVSKLCSFISSTKAQDIFSTIENIGIWNFRRVKALTLNGGYSLNSSVYNNIFNKIDMNIQEYWKNRMTLIHMGPLWIKNIFLNLYKIEKDKKISTIFAHPKTECPVLVTGAGESLENSINFIKEKRDFFKILAVDTSVSVLLENGIEPDFIIAVDAQIYNFYDFLEVKNKEIPLFFDITGYSGIPNVLNGLLFPFISNFANTRLLKRLEQYNLLPEKVPALGSVGLTAIYHALKITSNNVFYTGLDFAYKIGKSHANGSPRNLSELIVSTRLNPMEQPDIYYSRPLIFSKDKKNTNCITDLILSSYAELMVENFGDTDRLFDIGTYGLNSGGKLTEPDDLSLHKKCKGAKYPEPKKGIGSFIEFRKNELKMLSDLYNSVYKYLAGESENSRGLLELLKEADYVFLHFPDKSPEPTLDPVFLKRILVSCGYYINILNKYA